MVDTREKESKKCRRGKPTFAMLPSRILKSASYSVRAAAARAVETLLIPTFLNCSVKFGRKVQYVNYLHELQQHMELDQLPIPNQVKE